MTNTSSKYPVGTRIYYTGDMANMSGNFRVTATHDHGVTLEEDSGVRVFHRVMFAQIGDKYEGHCNPRFVPQTAVDAYRAKQRAVMTTQLAKARK